MMRRYIVLGAAVTALALWLWPRKRRRATPPGATPAPELTLGEDANLAFYAARFEAPSDAPLEPEHVLACALFDPRVAELVRARGIAIETARADLLAAARHLRSDAAARHDLNPGETYCNARASLRVMVSSRRAHEIAAARGATDISLGDLLRAFRERGGVLGELASADEAQLAALDATRAVTIAGRAPIEDGAGAAQADVFAVDDDQTPMELVMEVLRTHFGHTPARAAFAMLEAHEKGHGLVGRFPLEDARDRLARAAARLRERGAPLRFVLFAPAEPTG